MEKIVFSRKAFAAVTVHWALLVLAAPLITFFGNRDIFAVYWPFAFFSLVVLMLATPARKLMSGTANRPILPKLKRLARLSAAAAAVSVLLTAAACIILREGGPSIHDGAYVLWDHRVIREITQEEYLRLSIVERGMFCFGIVVLTSLNLFQCCHADEVE